MSSTLAEIRSNGAERHETAAEARELVSSHPGMYVVSRIRSFPGQFALRKRKVHLDHHDNGTLMDVSAPHGAGSTNASADQPRSVSPLGDGLLFSFHVSINLELDK